MPTQANISVATNNSPALIFRIIHETNGVRAPADLTGCRVDLDITFSGGKLFKTTADGGLVIVGAAGQISWAPTVAEARTLPSVGTATYALTVTYPDGDSRAFTGRYVSALGGVIEIADAGPVEVVEVILPILIGSTSPIKNVGTTDERPTLGASDRFIFFDLTLGAFIRWDGSAWISVNVGGSTGGGTPPTQTVTLPLLSLASPVSALARRALGLA